MLSSSNVEAIFKACLTTNTDRHSDFQQDIVVDGVCNKFAFDKAKIDENKQAIADMLYQLPEEFMEGIGDGYSFLHGCYDRNKNMWTGDHFMMEKLFALGMACGKVECLLPRELWPALPGGMPYYVVKK